MKIEKITLILLIIFSFFCSLSFAEVVKVAIKGDQEISDGRISLNNISEISGENVDLVTKLMKIDLGTAPEPGKFKRLSTNVIRDLILRNFNEAAQVNIEMPEQVIVRRSFQEVSKEEIEKVFLNFLDKEIKKTGKDLRVKRVKGSRGLVLPSGIVSYDIVPKKYFAEAGSWLFSINYKVSSQFEKELLLTAEIERYSDAVIAVHPLKRYQIVEASDVDLQEKVADGKTFSKVEDVLGKRTKRSINEGNVLTEDILELPPVVKPGDLVSIVVENSRLRISALGQVKEKGGVGENVKVVNKSSNKEIVGKVVSDKIVKVEF